jgi:hypothetical protein
LSSANNEWLNYLKNNIRKIDKDIGGSQWTKALLNYIENEQ